MTEVTNQFMWAYPHVLRGSVETNAHMLFKEIGWGVKCQVFLAGMRAADRPGRNPICLEPEDGKWPFAAFADLSAAVADAVPRHDLQKLLFDDETARREKPENILCTVVSEQVQGIAAQFDSSGDTRSFASRARRVGDYYVVVVVQVPKSELDALPVQAAVEGRCRATNFVYACIRQILDQAWDLLGTQEPGHTRINQLLYAREHARRAASEFLGILATITAGRWRGVDLFAALNDVSTLMYEGHENLGRLLLTDPTSVHVEYLLKLADPVPLREVRWSRKLIQLALGDAKLICNGEAIFGVGRWIGDSGSVFEVEFLAQRSWTLRRGKHEFLQSRFGDPKVPVEVISEERFLENYGMHFPRASIAAGLLVWRAVKDLQGLEHGSLLIVSEDAAAEAARLRDQGTVIKPTQLCADMLKSASQIDGAILVDPEGWCHAIGVIVDGSGNKLGSPSRGGRYNAAQRYVLISGLSRMAIIYSDDRTLDIIPLLPRRVSRTAVERMIKKLEAATLDSYHEARNFLEVHRFYLDEQQCERVNRALTRIHNEPRKWNRVVITSEPFAPNPAMEPRYWLNE